MNSTAFVAIGLAYACEAMLPYLSPKDFLFGVRVGSAFRASAPGRAVLRLYFAYLVGAAALSVVLIWKLGVGRAPTVFLASLLPMCGAPAGYFAAHRRLRRFGITQDAPVREADLSQANYGLPRWSLLALPAIAIPVAGAAWVQAHWGEIPQRIPVHFNRDGIANGWMTRTPLHVYRWFIFAEGLMLWLGLLAVVTYFGARRSSSRNSTLGAVILGIYLSAILFTGVGIQIAIRFPIWPLSLAIPFAVVAPILWMSRTSMAPQQPVDSTPDECWSAGGIYFNPDDAALFVPKRTGMGYTFNFGNPWAKWVLIAGVGGIGLLMAFLILASR